MLVLNLAYILGMRVGSYLNLPMYILFRYIIRTQYYIFLRIWSRTHLRCVSYVSIYVNDIYLFSTSKLSIIRAAIFIVTNKFHSSFET